MTMSSWMIQSDRCTNSRCPQPIFKETFFTRWCKFTGNKIFVLFSRAGMSKVFLFSRYDRSKKLNVEMKRFVCLEQLLCLTHSRHGRPVTWVHTHLRPAPELAQYIQPTVLVSGTTVCSTVRCRYSTISLEISRTSWSVCLLSRADQYTTSAISTRGDFEML